MASVRKSGKANNIWPGRTAKETGPKRSEPSEILCRKHRLGRCSLLSLPANDYTMTADECYEIILCDVVRQNRPDGSSVAQNGDPVAKFMTQ